MHQWTYSSVMAEYCKALKPRTLSEWLKYQESLHESPIDLGLERVGQVASRMGVPRIQSPVITVAGTNGKGSCVALLESIFIEAGYRVGSYTSPHIMCYNERIRINRELISDKALCDAFERVDRARNSISLSYFEFGTLAAFDLFQRADLEVMILEVGLGGRLDAVNICDADVALITSIALDHTNWLGPDREAIGFEKAGIMRSGIPVVCGDFDPPMSIKRRARAVKAPLFNAGVEYKFRRQFKRWSWYGPFNNWSDLPMPGLAGEVQLQNAATVLMCISLLQERLPVDLCAIQSGLKNADIPGRFQRIHGRVETILDIAHNPAAARVLATALHEEQVEGHTHAVFAVLSDKDAVGIVQAMRKCVDYWYLTEVESMRAMPFSELVEATRDQLSGAQVDGFSDASQAYQEAYVRAQEGDRIIVFGSALIVEPILRILGAEVATA